MTSAEVEREAEASRERLAATLGQLRHNLAPANFVDEILDTMGGQRGSSVIRSIESTIRRYPLPMMLMGVGTALWLSSAWRRGPARASGFPAELSRATSASGAPAQAPNGAAGEGKSLRDNIADVGRSVADRAYQVLRAHASAKLDQYAKAASSGMDSASEQLMQAVEGSLDKTVDGISSSMQKRPLAFSLIAIALGAALGGAALRTSAPAE
ncbi:MAG: DUF3618 domain-containing protein [Methylobacteriaceae bacterium]|nr:DUF3618 domain-containing protein [Methylobacteriaceae bacterium]